MGAAVATVPTCLGRVAYTVRGSGESGTCILLHGFPESKEEFAHIADGLASRHIRTLTPDLPGYGNESCKPQNVREYSARSIAACLRDLVHCTAGEPVAVAGHDWGGLCATALASIHPDSVSRLCLLNAPHLGSSTLRNILSRSPEQLLRSWYIYAFQLPALPERMLVSPLGVKRTLMQKHSTSADRAKRCSLATCGVDGQNTWHTLAYYRSLGRGGWSESFPLPQPLRCVFGTQDPVLSPALAKPDSTLVPHSRTIFLNKAGHFVHCDTPGAVIGQLERFVTCVDGLQD